ncbi:MAG: PRC-barrel domain-containing protein [Sphingomicrobium sp.]
MEPFVTWVAPVATTIAALLTASNLGSRITGYGFIVFTIGSLAWLALGIATGQPNLLWQNVILTVLNVFGIWRWLGRQVTFEEGGEAAQAQSRAAAAETLFSAALLGRAKVMSADGHELGAAVDAMIGCRSGRIAYLVASAGGVAGVGETLRRIDWTDVGVADDRIETMFERTAFDRLPPLDKDQWPGR